MASRWLVHVHGPDELHWYSTRVEAYGVAAQVNRFFREQMAKLVEEGNSKIVETMPDCYAVVHEVPE